MTQELGDYVRASTDPSNCEFAVGHRRKRVLVDFVLYRGQKRVRIDIHDGLENYDVLDTRTWKPLEGWEINYT